MIGPNIFLLVSTAASTSFLRKARERVKGASYVGSLRDKIPESIKKGDVIVVVSPSSSQDYLTASQLASSGVSRGIVLINGLAKVRVGLS